MQWQKVDYKLCNVRKQDEEFAEKTVDFFGGICKRV